MLYQLFQSPLLFLIVTISLLGAVTIHEFAHAWIADKLGDPTARLMGRITLNPLAHLDLIGTLSLLLVGFGWGKPVPFDIFNLQNPKRDTALIALAGPASNGIAIVITTVLFKLTGLSLLVYFIHINLVLGLFNLIPIAPLDGFKIVGGLLPDEQAKEWYSLEKYGMIFLLVLLFLPVIDNKSVITLIFPPLLDNILSFLLG